MSGETSIYCQRDTYFDVDLRDMAKSDARLVVAIKKLRKYDRYGTVFISKGGYINGFREKQPCIEGYINGGIYYVDRSLLEEQVATVFSFEKEILEKVYREIPVAGCIPARDILLILVFQKTIIRHKLYSRICVRRIKLRFLTGTERLMWMCITCTGQTN